MWPDEWCTMDGWMDGWINGLINPWINEWMAYYKDETQGDVNRRASRVGAGKGAMGAKSSSSLPVGVVVATGGAVVVVVVAAGGCVVSEYLFIKYTL